MTPPEYGACCTTRCTDVERSTNSVMKLLVIVPVKLATAEKAGLAVRDSRVGIGLEMRRKRVRPLLLHRAPRNRWSQCASLACLIDALVDPSVGFGMGSETRQVIQIQLVGFFCGIESLGSWGHHWLKLMTTPGRSCLILSEPFSQQPLIFRPLSGRFMPIKRLGCARLRRGSRKP